MVSIKLFVRVGGSAMTGGKGAMSNAGFSKGGAAMLGGREAVESPQKPQARRTYGFGDGMRRIAVVRVSLME